MPPRVTVVRWQGLRYNDREHLVLSETEDEFHAQSIYLSSGGPDQFGVFYELTCDKNWNFKQITSQIIGKENSRLLLRRDAGGKWHQSLIRRAADGKSHETEVELPQLEPAIDVDLSISPFTNTLPIRRLGMSAGQTSDINVAYLKYPEHAVSLDPQRYTCITNVRYLFESVDTEFQSEIQVDQQGLVTMYPQLFARI